MGIITSSDALIPISDDDVANCAASVSGASFAHEHHSRESASVKTPEHI
jgi:hypothetical protein